MVIEQRRKGLTQAKQIPISDIGLPMVGISALTVCVIADVTRIESVQKLKRPVVQSQAEDAHVVGVHHPMTKADRLPLRDHVGRAIAHRLQHHGVDIAIVLTSTGSDFAFGQMLCKGMVG